MVKATVRRTDLENNFERFVAGANDDIPPREAARYRYALSAVKQCRKVLDIGCSSGYAVRVWGLTSDANEADGLQYFGIDYDPSVIEYAKEQFGNVGQFMVFDITTPEFFSFLEAENFDAIIAFEILEHIENGREIAQKLKQFCKTLVCSVPYKEPPGFWGEHHKLHNLSRHDFPGFDYNFLHHNGDILSEPDKANFNLLLMKWERQFDDDGKLGVSVVIPHLNKTENLVCRLLYTIRGYTAPNALTFKQEKLNVEIVIVCNGTSPEEMELLNSFLYTEMGATASYVENFDGYKRISYQSAEYERLVILEYPQPLGYTVATNIGIRESHNYYILLLNNDVALLPQSPNLWLLQLLQPFREFNNCGITGTAKTHCYFGLGKFIIGYCLMTTRAVFNTLGSLLDERFNPGGMEDMDFAIRAQAIGYSIHQVSGERRVWNADAGHWETLFPLYHPSRSSTMHDLGNWQEVFDANIKKLGAKYSKYNEVTAVICTRNRADSTLALAISAIANQTKLPKRLLIFDQSDIKADLREQPIFAHLFAALDMKSVEWVHITHYDGQPLFGGQHISHELSQYGAEIVWRVDDDCVPEPDTLEKMLAYFEQHPDIGAIGGKILTPPCPNINSNELLAIDNSIENIKWKPCLQWYADAKSTDVEHLHCSFAYRAGIAHYNKFLSPVAHREESMFTHDILRAGYRVYFDADIVTWHYRNPSGGIRTGISDMWEHDEKIFEQWANSAGIELKERPKICLVEGGIGDHFAFRRALPDIIEKHGNVTVACAYPDTMQGEQQITIISIADAERILPEAERDALAVYKFMWANNWKGTLSDAFRAIYGVRGRDHTLPKRQNVNLGTGGRPLTVLFAPYARSYAHIENGNAKNYPQWEKVIHILENAGHTLIQIGAHGEKPLVKDCRLGLSYDDIKTLLEKCDTFLSVDTWLQHAAQLWYPRLRGVVVWGKSSPLIFGYQGNLNMIKSSKNFREKQFYIWQDEPFDASVFPEPEQIAEAVINLYRGNNVRNNAA